MMSTTNKVPTTEVIYVPSNNTLESIEGEPHANIFYMKANTVSLHSDFRGGYNGHFINTISETAFLAASDNVAFYIPTNP